MEIMKYTWLRSKLHACRASFALNQVSLILTKFKENYLHRHFTYLIKSSPLFR
jgi:hypothetical protein